MDATISVVCYKSKTLSNGEHPLMLRISKDGKKKYQSLGISVNPKFWDFQKNKPKPKCPNLEYLQKIILDKKLELQKKKLEIKSDQKEYSAATLLEANANLLVAKTVDCFYKEIIAQCEINNKCGNRLVYLNSYNSLKRFTNGKLEIPFNSINVAWLEKYEKWLRSNGNKETTISLMFRTLRSTYNKAIKERCAHLSDYPFQEYKISKFDTSTQKRAIAKTDMLKFTETSQPIGQKKYVELSKDIFIFSYLCGGINFTDIANLTQENIVNGRHQIRVRNEIFINHKNQSIMIKTVNLQKIFKTEEVQTLALNDVNIEVKEGEFVAIMGPSGCGKSTLLNILGLLDNPTSGEYYLNGTEVSKYTEAQRTNLRKGVIGFVFQSFNLIDELNVYENIELPLLYMGIPATERKRRVETAMERMAIMHRSKHFPQQLSGGQQQRVAIARAVVSNPKLILADEPTGNLDSKNGKEVMELLNELNKEGTTIVMVTHSQHDAGFAGRIINLFDGQVVTEANL